MTTVKWADLQPGQRYRVTMDDCCVEGWFNATFLHHEGEEDDPKAYAAFDTAHLGTSWGKYTFTPLEAEARPT